MKGNSESYKKLWFSMASCVFIGLGGCFGLPNPISLEGGNYRDAARALPYAAAAPFRDLNIGVKPIPPQLATLQNPYGTDTHRSCALILREAQDLVAALEANERILQGPDYNMNTRAGYVAQAAEGAVTTAATTFIPFRGPIRYVSGAKKREKLSQEAGRRGRERLGFLIGVGSASNCPGFYPRSRPVR